MLYGVHCQITPGGFLPTNEIDLSSKHTCTTISNYITSNTYRYSANEEKLLQLRGEWKLRSNWTTRHGVN